LRSNQSGGAAEVNDADRYEPEPSDPEAAKSSSLQLRFRSQENQAQPDEAAVHTKVFCIK